MRSVRILKLLVAALSAHSVVEAFLIDAALRGRNGKELLERQLDLGGLGADITGSGNTVAATTDASTSAPATTDESTTSVEATPTSTSEATTTDSAVTTAPTTTDDATPTTTTSSEDTSATTSPSSGATSTSSGDATTTSAPDSSTTTSATPVTSTAVVVVTASDGSVSSSTSMSVSTPTAALSQGGSSGSGSSGMSKQTRNTIIGVVVGVGGAIVLAVAGVFAWRIWGRNRHNEEADGLMGYNNGAEGKSEVGTGLGPAAASSAAGSRSPFTDTLESYHGPTAKPNTAANF